ncbi:MAG TPA: hypothetical protein VGF29_00010 [Hyphomicrobiaceae bacterium]|jgi:hypothetical protein
MFSVDRVQRRWLVAFGLTLACFVGAAFWLYLRLPSYRSPAFDFRMLKPDEAFNAQGLTRRQDGSLKLGFAESYPPPAIGAYGNHVIGHFGSDAFGRPPDPAYFFNFGYANLALPEVHAYLLHLERLGHLPRRLAIVQVTTPNNDNGRYIVDWGNELPPDVVLEGLPGGRVGNLGEAVTVAARVLVNELHEVFSYNTAILSLVQGGRDHRIVGPAACTDAAPAWLLRLPTAVRSVVGPRVGRPFYCLPHYWWLGYRRDGSNTAPGAREGGGDRPLVQNENPLKDSERALNAGDERRIARYLRAIDAIGRRNGVKVAFLVPPVYETDRRDSVVNQVFDRALALVPEIAILDHRGLGGDATLFADYNHPSAKYYRLVVQELRRRGLLDEAAPLD